MQPKRSIRTHALTACLVAALAVPAGASAMPRGDGPIAVRHENMPVAAASHPTPASVVREIRTVTDGTDQTLPTALAAIALAVALCGTGYVALRLRPMLPRR
jgi:hypothetical protein